MAPGGGGTRAIASSPHPRCGSRFRRVVEVRLAARPSLVLSSGGRRECEVSRRGTASFRNGEPVRGHVTDSAAARNRNTRKAGRCAVSPSCHAAIRDADMTCCAVGLRLSARRGRRAGRGPCGRSGRPKGEPRRPPRQAHRPRGRASRRPGPSGPDVGRAHPRLAAPFFGTFFGRPKKVRLIRKFCDSRPTYFWARVMLRPGAQRPTNVGR
jgi:hypothetical protein